MRTSLVLTLLGDDRPGIVEQLSERILEAGANWEESRMARLAGKFAGILRVTVETEQADPLTDALRSLTTGGLTVAIEPSAAADVAPTRTVRLELTGNDHPGIVRDIARVLAQHGVNIEELETDVTGAPMTGEPLFHAKAVLQVPSVVGIEQLVHLLEAIAGELMVDLALEPSESVPS